ncbi:hypothetical protein MGG_17093 [Pyricularia oryzae 70-15]|uniref:Uncharacterized protein n=1 Tax=Pyricularia oryzae (strain 70-15 / ATCC MYA-4617 / FGSC 8958) TaxID=242507 RepID=G4N8C2_PYRO7|nr:uncharacterized protein MGG_17093 [Pyricularia oryzae 70-15]EHA50169.1 hypothetical protein MGG_17093 [Pyricularia oryzae 70-15]
MYGLGSEETVKPTGPGAVSSGLYLACKDGKWDRNKKYASRRRKSLNTRILRAPAV